MSYLTMYGNVFDGLPNGTDGQAHWQPTSYAVKEKRVNVVLEAANGTRNLVERSVLKHVWEIGWEPTNNATMLTLRGIARLYTTFTLIDIEAVSFTAQIEDEFAPEWAFNTPAGAAFWKCKLVIHEK